MFGRSKRTALKENAASGADVAVALAQDKKFRRQLLEAVGHGATARRRVAARSGVLARSGRLATDDELRREIRQIAENLRTAWGRVERKRNRRGRRWLLLVGAGGLVAAVPQVRERIWAIFSGATRPGSTSARVITESIEVEVPVSTAYNQWTQFEDFPLFMEGVDHVQQLDDTRLHWVASIAGKKAEWDAKILEQHSDRQISWISEDGKKTRGTVIFEELSPSRTRVSLSMSYLPEGVAEVVGSAAGLDQRRVRGDLERFKELIESRGQESGAWRGEVSAGKKQ